MANWNVKKESVWDRCVAELKSEKQRSGWKNSRKVQSSGSENSATGRWLISSAGIALSAIDEQGLRPHSGCLNQ